MVGGRPLRIGICVDQFPKTTKTHVVNLVTGLLDRGVDVQVFAGAPSPHWDAYPQLSGRDDLRDRVHYSRVPQGTFGSPLLAGRELAQALVHAPLGLSRLVAHNLGVRKLHRLGWLSATVRRLHFLGSPVDLIHFPVDGQALQVADVKAVLGCPVAVSVCSTLQRTRVFSDPWTREYLFSVADGYHFVSEYTRRNTIDLGLRPDVASWVIPYSIDDSAFSSRPSSRTPSRELPPNQPLEIISVGRLVWEKGLEFGLQAVAGLVRRGMPVHYTIVGSGPYEEPLRLAAAQLGLTPAEVTFAGSMVLSDVRDAYERADVMLHPALDDTYPNVLLEAQAMGLPIVASDLGGIPEIVTDAVSGYLVGARDVLTLERRLGQIATDVARSRAMGVAAREQFVARNSYQGWIEAILAMYTDLVARGRTSRS